MGTVNISMSESGKNAFYHHCATKDQRCNYAVCLSTIKKCNTGTLRPQQDRQNCDSSIKRNECPAALMRQEEIKAKESLYYVPRENAEASYMKGYNAVRYAGTPAIVTSSTPKYYASASSAKSKLSQIKKPRHDELMNVDVAKVLSEVAKEEKKPAANLATNNQDALALMMGR